VSACDEELFLDHWSSLICMPLAPHDSGNGTWVETLNSDVAAKKSFIAVYAVGYSLTVLWHDLFVCRLLAGSECL